MLTFEQRVHCVEISCLLDQLAWFLLVRAILSCLFGQTSEQVGLTSKMYVIWGLRCLMSLDAGTGRACLGKTRYGPGCKFVLKWAGRAWRGHKASSEVWRGTVGTMSVRVRRRLEAVLRRLMFQSTDLLGF